MSREPIAATGRFADRLVDPLFSNAFARAFAREGRCLRHVRSFGSRPSGMGQHELSHHLTRLPHLTLFGLRTMTSQRPPLGAKQTFFSAIRKR